MPLVGRHVVCTCGRPMPAVAIRPGVVCALCGRDMNTYYWEERDRLMAEEAAMPKGRGRPPKKRYYR